MYVIYNVTKCRKPGGRWIVSSSGAQMSDKKVPEGWCLWGGEALFQTPVLGL